MDLSIFLFAVRLHGAVHSVVVALKLSGCHHGEHHDGACHLEQKPPILVHAVITIVLEAWMLALPLSQVWGLNVTTRPQVVRSAAGSTAFLTSACQTVLPLATWILDKAILAILLDSLALGRISMPFTSHQTPATFPTNTSAESIERMHEPLVMP